jgi:hypothetical protein
MGSSMGRFQQRTTSLPQGLRSNIWCLGVECSSLNEDLQILFAIIPTGVTGSLVVGALTDR